MGLWAGIKYALNSTLGTEGFQPLDKLIFKGFYPDTEINYEGNNIQYETTIKIPMYAKRAVITACAGGGAGGTNQTYNNGGYGGSGGGGGGYVYKEPFEITEDMWDTNISITIGSGGVAGARPDGAATIIGNFVTLLGGTGGALGGNISSFSTTGGSPNGGDGGQCIGTGAANFKLAQDTAQAAGGGLGARRTGTPISTSDTSAHRYGGGGGASLGDGGAGGTYATNSNYKDYCTGANGIKGGGGGGSASISVYTAQQYTGGNGGNGYVKIEWELY